MLCVTKVEYCPLTEPGHGEAITSVTEGDFTVNVTAKGNDEVAIMSRSMQKFIETMRKILKEIGNMSNQLKDKAESSSKIAESLYHSAKDQSTSMGELNATVDELAKSVGEIAESATALAAVVSETGAKGEKASQKMTETVNVSGKEAKELSVLPLL